MLEDNFLLKLNMQLNQISSEILCFVGLPLEQFILICSALSLLLALWLVRIERKRFEAFRDVAKAPASASPSAKATEDKKATAEKMADKQEVSSKESVVSDSKAISYEAGLKASRSTILSRVSNWFSSNKTINKENARELEDILISSDLGVQTSKKIVQGVLEDFNPEDDIRAVSYTHLRAHETGRNLVCRLLLEKKK